MAQSNKYFIGSPTWVTPYDIKLDEKISQFNPAKPDWDYASLKTQIETDGQIDPAYVRGNLLGDGRHRLQIAKELGRKLLIQEIDKSMPDEEYIRLCNKNTFGARNDTPAQAAIKAYTLVKEYKYTDAEAIRLVGVKDKNALTYIRYIMDTRHAKVIENLKNGGRAEVKNKQGEVVYQGIALKTLKEKIARLEEKEMLIVDNSCEVIVELDYNEYLNTETAKDEFWIHIGKNPTVSADTKKLFCELLNLKYKLK